MNNDKPPDFYQAFALWRSIAIARQIVQNHGGTLPAAEHAGILRFTFTLPVIAAGEASTNPSVAPLADDVQ